MSITEAVIIFVSAFVAGTINSIAGGGTLLTFPALIWIGLDPKMANATSTVALWPGLLGGAWGYRREMQNSRAHLVRLGIPSVIGGAVGGAILIATPTETFARLVPYLILSATALFILQGSINRRFRLQSAAESPTPRWWTVAMIFQFFSAIYGGYFGAGNGIVMLSVLGLLGVADIHRANGIKTFLGACLNSAAVVGFIVSNLVHWPEAILMSIAALLGGYTSTHVARRLGRVFVRRTVIAIGLSIGLLMLWRMNS